MRWYEITTGIHRKRPGYTGLIAILCLFASMFLAWAVLEMSSRPVTTGMTSNASVNSAAKP
jgi:hypothetical protein